MARRKQQHPQANVGPVEVRHEQPDPEPAEPELDIDEWEEQNAVDCRPRKKARNQSKARTIELYTKPQVWEFASVEAFIGEDVQEGASSSTASLLFPSWWMFP